MGLLAFSIDWAIRILTLVVITDVVLTYFMDPLHPVRKTLDRVVEPMLAPIRKRMPSTGSIDFSPVVLVLGLLLLNQLLQAIFRRF
jgi:YggT family protein